MDYDEEIKEGLISYTSDPGFSKKTYKLIRQKEYYEIFSFYAGLILYKNDDKVMEFSDNEERSYIFHYVTGVTYYLVYQVPSSFIITGFEIKASKNNNFNVLKNNTQFTLSFYNLRTFNLSIPNEDKIKQTIQLSYDISYYLSSSEEMEENGLKFKPYNVKYSAGHVYIFAILSDNLFFFPTLAKKSVSSTLNTVKLTLTYITEEVNDDKIYCPGYNTFRFFKLESSKNFYEISRKNLEAITYKDNFHSNIINEPKIYSTNEYKFILVNTKSDEGCTYIRFMYDEQNSISKDGEYTLYLFRKRNFDFTFAGKNWIKLEYTKGYYNLSLYLPDDEEYIPLDSETDNSMIFSFNKTGNLLVQFQFDISSSNDNEYKKAKFSIVSYSGNYFSLISFTSTCFWICVIISLLPLATIIFIGLCLGDLSTAILGSLVGGISFFPTEKFKSIYICKSR